MFKQKKLFLKLKRSRYHFPKEKPKFLRQLDLTILLNKYTVETNCQPQQDVRIRELCSWLSGYIVWIKVTWRWRRTRGKKLQYWCLVYQCKQMKKLSTRVRVDVKYLPKIGPKEQVLDSRRNVWTQSITAKSLQIVPVLTTSWIFFRYWRVCNRNSQLQFWCCV